MQCLQHLLRHYEVSWVLPLSNTIGSCYQYKGRVSLSVHSLGLVINMLICTGPLYQYGEVCWARALLSVQWIDNEVCTDKFCTDSESDWGGLIIRTVPITRPCVQAFQLSITRLVNCLHTARRRLPARLCRTFALHLQKEEKQEKS